ncbi:MAG: response regulator [Ginsengibacter sp.]
MPKSVIMGNKKCVLIFDDDLELLILCKIIFKKANYRVETRIICDNIIEDIKKVEPDIVLMDLWIPKMGGEEAIKLMRRNADYQNVPVLLFSANDEIEKISKRSGATSYVRKPFDIFDLKNEVDKWT